MIKYAKQFHFVLSVADAVKRITVNKWERFSVHEGQ